MEALVAGESLKPRPLDDLPRIPGYRIEGVLGRGATGVVYSATQIAVDRPVALKILHPELVGTKRAVRRLQREARTAARLAHPNIISAIDMGEVGGRWWYAMELVEGIPLDERIKEQGTLSERDALRLFIPLCEALQHLYQGGVVHRDVKPANILVDAHGRARLVDLGLAFAEDDPLLTSAGGTLGTPHYISPEQARDSARADSRSDIWSLGATLYHALCGRPPFQGESVAEVLSGVLYDRVEDPRRLAPHLSRGMALVVRKCLARDPARRYQEPVELLRDLERIRERRHPTVHAAALDPVASRRPPWVRSALLAGTAAGTLVILALAWLRPWEEAPVPPGTLAAAAWPQIAAVRENLAEGRVDHRSALAELEAMQVPESVALQWNRAKTEILADLDRELAAWRDSMAVAFEDALERRDLSAATALLERDLPADLHRRSGYTGVAELPSGRRERETAFRDQLAVALAERRQALRAEARAVLRRVWTEEVHPTVAGLGSAHRWRDALRLLDESPRDWLEQGGADLSGLDASDLDEIASALAADEHESRRALRRSWAMTDGELKGWIDRKQQSLRDELERGDERDVAAELGRAFHEKLEEEGISLEQLPEEWGPSNAFAHVQVAVMELAAREARLVQDHAREVYAEDTLAAAELCRERRYAEAAALWSHRIADARFESLLPTLRLRLRECELLRDLLERAAAGVEERSGETFEVYLKSIAETGRIEPGADPLMRGFELVTPHGRRRIFLAPSPASGPAPVLMRCEELELLAGIADSNEPEDRLLKSLLRFYEGQVEDAQRALPVGLLAEDPLVADLKDRIERASLTASRERIEREKDLEGRLRSLKWNFQESRHVVRPQKLLADVAELRRRYAEMLSLEQMGDLRRIEQALQSSLVQPTIEEVFGPFAEGGIELGPHLDVTLRFRFDRERVGPWERGRWAPGRAGWALGAPLEETADLFRDDAGPRLALIPPFDAAQRMRVQLELENLAEADARILVVSVAGYHAVFLDEPARPRFLVDTTGAADVTARLLLGEPSGFRGFHGFPEGRFSLELALSPLGTFDVSLAGRRLHTLGQYRTPRPDSPELCIAASHPARIVEVVLDGRRRPH